ncbi:MAG: hypothetical protein Q8R18_05435 [bacterium]|nr:hypothetical protein [bacterium]
MINKRGDGNESFSWIIGTIAGVMLTSIILTVGIQWYATTQKTEDSFDSLTAKIEELKDGEKTFMAYYLPDGYLLVSFSGQDFITGVSEIPGQSYVTGQSCAGTVQIPDACGSEDCICVCDGSYKTIYENACLDKPICYPFTSKATKEYSFTDTECSTGFYREGPNNGVFTLFLQRQGNEIKFCSNEECVNENYKEIVASFEDYKEKYKSCATSNSCICTADPSFLGISYALVFSGKEVKLWDIGNAKYIDTFETESNIEVQGSEAFSEQIILYSMSIADAPNVVGTSATQQWIISPSIADIQTSAYDSSFDDTFTKTHMKIEGSPQKENNILYFVSEGTDICKTNTNLLA